MRHGFLAAILSLLLLLTSVPGAAEAPPRILVDGAELILPPDQQPFIESGRTLVPLRAIFEALGATVEWDGSTQTVTGTLGPRRVVLRAGSTAAKVDGRDVQLQQPAVIIGGRTFVPLRFVSEALGAAVAWEPVTRTATITSEAKRAGDVTPGSGELAPVPHDSGLPAPPPLKGAPLPAHNEAVQTEQVGILRVVVRQEPTFTWPLETPKLHLVATNTGNVPIQIPYSVRVVETGQEAPAHPQPPILYLAPGESQPMSTILDAEAGRLNTLPFNHLTQRTVVWEFQGQGTVRMPVQVQRVDVIPRPGDPRVATAEGMRVAGRVVDEAGRPVGDVQVEVRAGGTGFPTGTSRAGEFTLGVPRSVNWVLTAAKTGYYTAYVFLDEARDYADLTVMLRRHPDRGYTYGAAQVLDTDNIGYWQGTVTPDDSLILLPQGMEIWNQELEPFRRDALLALYTTGGEKRWDHEMGYEAWGADISGDKQWAVYATKDSVNPRLGLLDARTGKLGWEKALSTASFPTPSAFTGHQSNEVRFSPDAQHIAVATGEGDLYLIRRSDGAIVWSAFLGGQVRAVVFSPDGKYLFAGAGSGYLSKLAVADGSKVWRAPIGSWPLLDGMKLSPDGTKIGTMTKAGEATVVDAATGKVLFTFDTAGIGQWADFSGDSKVFVASSFGGTYGFVAETGERLFRLDGGKAGRFARGQNFFVFSGAGNAAVYDYWGTRISNHIPGLDPGASLGQFAWVSADGRTVMLAATGIQRPGSPVLFVVRGAPSAVPVDSGRGPGSP